MAMDAYQPVWISSLGDGLFYSRVLKASPLSVKEIKVGEHLVIAYESNAHVPCLGLFCAQSCGLEMVQLLGVHNVGPSC